MSTIVSNYTSPSEGDQEFCDAQTSVCMLFVAIKSTSRMRKVKARLKRREDQRALTRLLALERPVKSLGERSLGQSQIYCWTKNFM